jgi:hypothetical protein
MPPVAKKRVTRIRLGDLIRVMWKVPGKTSGTCRTELCGWSCGGISYPNVLREARKHTREKGHATRIASIEVIEYRRLAS